MPEQVLLRLKNAIKPQWKTAFFAALIIGFLTHLFMFTNAIPNHDSLLNIHMSQKKFSLGRFFLSPFSGISSYFDLPWVNGALSIFYLALTSAALTELFGLRKKTVDHFNCRIARDFPDGNVHLFLYVHGRRLYARFLHNRPFAGDHQEIHLRFSAGGSAVFRERRGLPSQFASRPHADHGGVAQ